MRGGGGDGSGEGAAAGGRNALPDPPSPPPRCRVGSLQYAADTAAAILPAYEALFGVPYALPKLDLAAIPDFSAGAMENWGLITYRETALLASDTSSILDRRYVALVIAHEMAHLWFGDLGGWGRGACGRAARGFSEPLPPPSRRLPPSHLARSQPPTTTVTMQSWGELWLNEGFASYFEYAGATAGERERASAVSWHCAPFSRPSHPPHPPPLALRARACSPPRHAVLRQLLSRRRALRPGVRRQAELARHVGARRCGGWVGG